MTSEQIVILVLLAALLFMIAGSIDAARRRRRAKPEPVPWNGLHQLKGIRHVTDYGNMPDDFTTGWLWACTCGIDNKHNYWRLPYTEVAALTEYKAHKQAYKDLEKSDSLRALNHAVENGA